jgi:hypothetical protein
MDAQPRYRAILGKSSASDPDIEKLGLSSVASYGKQLGRIGDALLVLLRHLPPPTALSAGDRRVIDDLRRMPGEIANVKHDHGAKFVISP